MSLPTPRISLPFNGNWLDKSGNGNDVTPNGITLENDTPKIGSGYAKANDAADGEITDSPSLDANYITVPCWIRYTTALIRIVYERGSGAGFAANDWDLVINGGKLVWKVHVGGAARSVTSPLVYNDGNWHLVIGLYDGAFVRLFVDNVYVEELAAAHGVIGAQADPVTLCARKGVTLPFIGSMDSFILYGEALNFGGVAKGNPATGQIAEIWNDGAGIEPSGSIYNKHIGFPFFNKIMGLPTIIKRNGE